MKAAASGTQAADVPAHGPLLRLGLMQGLGQMSKSHGITHCCALMEPTLLRMLEAMAIRFHPIGKPVEFHGLHQPCYVDIAEMSEEVRRERPSFWDVLSDGGLLAPAPRLLRAVN